MRPASYRYVGRHEVAGLWVPGVDVATQRQLLAWWRPGSTVCTAGEGLWLRWPVPVELRVEAVPGLPVVETRAGRWQTGPFTDDGEDGLALGWHGRVIVQPMQAMPRVALDALGPEPPPRVPSRGLGAPPVVVGVDEAEPQGLGEVLGVRDVVPVKPPGSGPAKGVAGWLASLLGAVPALPASSAFSGGGVAGGSGQVGAAPPPSSGPSAPPPSSLWQSLLRGLGLFDLLYRWALRSLSKDLYDLEELLARDLDAFLRRALPLGRAPGDGGGGMPSFGLEDREVRFDRPRGGGGGGGLQEDAWDFLEVLYGQALKQFERAGRHREAAYVLAELLDKPHEALAYLERHELFQEAADLAKARDLGASVVVRCLVQAGRFDEAVRYARIHGVLGEAVHALEAVDAALASRLRRVWARRLWTGGHLAAAVAAIWSDDHGKDMALLWIDELLASGDVVPPAILARRLVLRPHEVEAVEPALTGILTQEGPPGIRARATLVSTLHQLVPVPPTDTPSWGPLVRRVVCASLPDLAPHTSHQRVLRTLGAHDLFLGADLPPPPRATLPTLSERSSPERLFFDGLDVGTMPVLDAVPLPGERVLLALGEVGVELWGADGRRLRRWPVPARHLVPSDTGHVVFAGVERGEVTSWVRLDVGSGTHHGMGELPTGPFADSFDEGWWVTEGDRLTLLDPTAEGWSGLWSTHFPGIMALGRDGARLGVLALARSFGRPTWQLSEYDHVTLRRCTDLTLHVKAHPHDVRLLDVLPAHVVFAHGGELHTVPSCYVAKPPQLLIDGVQLVQSGRFTWWRELVPGEDARERLLVDSRCVQVVRRPELAGARIHAGALVTYDRRGRVQVLDLEHGALLLDLRR